MKKKNVGEGFNKYPNGFMPKIAYWTSELMAEVANTKKPDLSRIDSIHRKLDYFIQREWDRTLEVKF
jgi:hypothetical protein